MRNECNIIRDILPLYIEDMVSADTVSFVEEHLESCAECREELSKLKKSTETADRSKPVSTSYVNEAAPLKAVKKRLRRKQILTILLSFIVAALLVFGVVSALFLWGIPTTAENIKLETEYQYAPDAYLNQMFVLHMEHMTDKPISTSVKCVYQTDESGNKIHVGYEITVREIPFGNNPSRFTMSYDYNHSSPPADDFDFTITVKFRDTTVTYSMVEEGLFVPQDVIQYH